MGKTFGTKKYERATKRQTAMDIKQNDMEHILDLLQRGEITAYQANVKKVMMKRVQLVIAKLPMQVRKSLNNAVKAGELAHIKKDGHMPEAYYHPTFEYLAIAGRNQHEREVLNAIRKISWWSS